MPGSTPRGRPPGRVVGTPTGIAEQNDWNTTEDVIASLETKVEGKVAGVTVGGVDDATNEAGLQFFEQTRLLFDDASFTVEPVDGKTVKVKVESSGGTQYEYFPVVLQAEDNATTNAVGQNHFALPQDGWTQVRLCASDTNPAGAVDTNLELQYWDGATWVGTGIDIDVDNTDPGVVGSWENLPAGFTGMADPVWIRLLDTGGDADSDIGHAVATFRKPK